MMCGERKLFPEDNEVKNLALKRHHSCAVSKCCQGVFSFACQKCCNLFRQNSRIGFVLDTLTFLKHYEFMMPQKYILFP